MKERFKIGSSRTSRFGFGAVETEKTPTVSKKTGNSKVAAVGRGPGERKMLVCSNAGMQTTHLPPKKHCKKIFSVFKNSCELFNYYCSSATYRRKCAKNIPFLWSGIFIHNCENLKTEVGISDFGIEISTSQTNFHATHS